MSGSHREKQSHIMKFKMENIILNSPNF